MINQDIEALKRDLHKRTEPARVKGALNFYAKHNEVPLVDVALNFGIEFKAIYDAIELLRLEHNKTRRKQDRVKKISLRDHAIAYMKANPGVTAYCASRLVGLQTEASITNALRQEYKASGKHLIPCSACHRIPSVKSRGRPLDANSKLAKALSWREANPEASDYEATVKFGLKQRSALSVYRKRLAKAANRCMTCGQPYS